MNLKLYCVYFTFYKGNLLPPFYIGYTTVSKVLKGYNGTVVSKEFKHIWRSERFNNHHLFRTTIISYHTTKEEAREKETRLQKALNVVNNPLYINKAIFDNHLRTNNTRRGKPHNSITKEKISKSMKKFYTTNKGKEMIKIFTEYQKSERGILNRSLNRVQRVVDAYSIDGIFIRSFSSIIEASTYFKVKRGNITACCRHRGKYAKTLGGVIWCYKGDKPLPYKAPSVKGIIQIDIKSNKIINEYDSLSVAAKSIKGSIGNISSCASGRLASAYGYKWIYKNSLTNS